MEIYNVYCYYTLDDSTVSCTVLHYDYIMSAFSNVNQLLRKAAKKKKFLMTGPLRPHPPPPLSELKFFFLPTIFGLKEPYFLPNIATNLFANIVSIDSLICSLK